MVMRPVRLIVVGIGVFAAMGLTPALAGWFDGKPSEPQAANDDPSVQVQRDIDEEEYLDAGKLLDQALLADASNPRLILQAAQLALVNARYDVALTNFKMVDSKPEERPRALEGEGIALSMLGKSEQAFATLQSAVALDPAAWRAWNALGTEYDRRHDWKGAEDAYAHAIANSASNAIVLNNRGFSRLCQNRLDEAVDDFVTALSKKPDFTAARNNLRLAIGMKGEYERAMEGADPSDRAAVLNNVGFAALMRGDYAAAKSFFDQAIKARGTYYALAASNLATAHDLELGQQTRPDSTHAGSH
jgi:Flp pilus assembly protein TadD